MTEPSEYFRVLFVCTGNICRSPVAEQVARERFGRYGVEVSSAGTRAIDGDIMPQQAEAISRGLGADPSRHRAERLDIEKIEKADLVIAMEREHRSSIVRAVPRASRYTFTLRELARVLDNVASESGVDVHKPEGVTLAAHLRSLVPVVAARRGFAEQPAKPEYDDVSDPYRRSQQVYDRSGEQIAQAFASIAESINQLTAASRDGGISATLR